MSDHKPRPTFPIEEIATFPPPGMALPNAFAFTHDDRLLAYLYGTGQPPVQQLLALDVAAGQTSTLVQPPGGGVREDQLSPEEELRRQRERNLSVGLTHF